MNSKICLVIIGLIGIAFLSYPANAETITLNTITNPPIYSFTGSTGSTTVDLTKLVVDTTDYNVLHSVFVTFTPGTAPTFPKQTDSTTCHIVSGGSGNCVVAYSSATHAISWYFSNPSTVTSSPIVLSYDNDIFNGMSFTNWGFTTGQLGLTQPVFLSDTSNREITDTPLSGTSYSVSVESSVSNSFNIIYNTLSGNSIFTTQINKSGAFVATKVFIENATGTPKQYPIQGDTTFNKVNYNATNFFGQGIALNMTIASGGFERVIVNTTNSTVPPTPTPAPTPPPQNSNGFGISFDQASYNTGDSGNIITNNTFGSLDFSSYTVDFFNTKTPLIAQFQVDKSQSIQNFSVSFDTADTYTANLVQHPVFGSDTIVATASVQAIQPQGFINSDNLVQVGKAFNVTYKYGVTPTFSHINGIKTIFINGGVPVQESFFTTASVTGGTEFTTQIFVNQKGSYMLQLFDAGRGVVAQKAITSDFFQSTNTSLNITTSNISILNPPIANAYGFNDLMQVTWQTDNANYTNPNLQIEIDVFNNDTNTETIAFPESDQAGSFSFFLQNGYYKTGFFSSGNNQVRLIAKNDTFTSVLDFKNFTISGVNNNGYGLSSSQYTACIDDLIKITYTTPESANFSIILINPNGNVGLESGVVNGTSTITRSFSQAGQYATQLIRTSDNSLQQENRYTINTCASPSTTSQQGQQQQQSATINFLGSMSFIGMIIFIMIVGTGFIMGGLPGGLMAALAITPLMWLAPGDFDVSASSPNGHMIPTWVLFLEFAIVMMIIAIFAANKLTKTGGDQ